MQTQVFFYSSVDTDISSLIDNIGHAFPDYEKSTFNFEDAEWQTYFEDLYPNAIGLNEISNRHVLNRLADIGDDLNLPREIDHTVIFHNRKQAKEFEAIVKEMGFTVEVEIKGFFNKTYDLLVRRSDTPSKLDPITFELGRSAENLGGSYDGWGCVAVTDRS